jgi:hypothetical protein
MKAAKNEDVQRAIRESNETWANIGVVDPLKGPIDSKLQLIARGMDSSYLQHQIERSNQRLDLFRSNDLYVQADREIHLNNNLNNYLELWNSGSPEANIAVWDIKEGRSSRQRRVLNENDMWTVNEPTDVGDYEYDEDIPGVDDAHATQIIRQLDQIIDAVQKSNHASGVQQWADKFNLLSDQMTNLRLSNRLRARWMRREALARNVLQMEDAGNKQTKRVKHKLKKNDMGDPQLDTQPSNKVQPPNISHFGDNHNARGVL